MTIDAIKMAYSDLIGVLGPADWRDLADQTELEDRDFPTNKGQIRFVLLSMAQTQLDQVLDLVVERLEDGTMRREFAGKLRKMLGKTRKLAEAAIEMPLDSYATDRYVR